jgi:hypothetical protein
MFCLWSVNEMYDFKIKIVPENPGCIFSYSYNHLTTSLATSHRRLPPPPGSCPQGTSVKTLGKWGAA